MVHSIAERNKIVKGDLHSDKETYDLECAVCGVCRSGSLKIAAKKLAKYIRL
jgi:hypothetical protein